MMRRVEGDLGSRIDTLVDWIHESRHMVMFTGAGISTDSGLPDYRGPDGVWTRRDKGLPPKSDDRPWDSVEPNSGHLAVVELQSLGKLKFLISQNIDNLHLKSGIREELIAELHGNISRVRCAGCEMTYPTPSAPELCECGGRLVSSVVDFGMSLPQKDLEMSFEHAQKSDLFLVVGSSLVVTPAANIPLEAMRAGAKLAIINKGETPLDAYCHMRFEESIGSVLPQIAKKLKSKMWFFE